MEIKVYRSGPVFRSKLWPVGTDAYRTEPDGTKPDGTKQSTAAAAAKEKKKEKEKEEKEEEEEKEACELRR